MKNTKTLVLTALMTALCCVATMIIRIPTPTMGYIHPGDGFVLLSSLLLGPVLGPLAAGLGSALSDLFAGYLTYVPATFIIKALTSLVGYLIFQLLADKFSKAKDIPTLVISGAIGECVMVLGYFLFEIFMLATVNGTSVAAGIIASSAGIIPNIIQAIFGVLISTVLYPILKPLTNKVVYA